MPQVFDDRREDTPIAGVVVRNEKLSDKFKQNIVPLGAVAVTAATIKLGLINFWANNNSMEFAESAGYAVGGVFMGGYVIGRVAENGRSRLAEWFSDRKKTFGRIGIAGMAVGTIGLAFASSDGGSDKDSTSFVVPVETSAAATSSEATSAASTEGTTAETGFQYLPLPETGHCAVLAPIKKDSPKEAVQEFQQMLKDYGYYDGPIDGYVPAGGQTSKAVDKLQQAIGMPEELAKQAPWSPEDCYQASQVVPGLETLWVSE